MATILSMYITKGKKEKLQVAQCAIGKAKVSFSALLLSRTEGLLCVLVEKTLSEAVDCILNDIHTRDKIMNFMKLFLVMSLYISLCFNTEVQVKSEQYVYSVWLWQIWFDTWAHFAIHSRDT